MKRHSALIAASLCLVVSGCSGKKSEPKAQDAKASKPAPSAKEDAKAAAGKAEDPSAKAAANPPADAANAPAKDAAAQGGAGKPPTGRSFSKGDRALGGVTASEVPFYNKAQGDPIDGDFTMAMACEGQDDLCDKSKGKLFATFKTNLGSFRCELYEDKAPLSVANFVGLARGVRPFLDAKTKSWTKAPFYKDVIFHRVIDGFMIQTGDRSGSGRGGPGYFVKDEFDKSLRHDAAGYLSMANRNRINPATGTHFKDKTTQESLANTGSSQFFVTVAATPHLNDKHAIFGKCDPTVPVKISKVKVQNRPPFADHRPFDPVKIESLTIERSKK